MMKREASIFVAILLIMTSCSTPDHRTETAEDILRNYPPNRTWTIGGRHYPNLNYLGTINKDGQNYVRLAPQGLGLRSIPFDQLSQDDIDAVNAYERLRKLREKE